MRELMGVWRYVTLILACPALAAPSAAQPLQFEQETLANGLHVIYAPLHAAPVVHVRVVYHVGSRDERPDRQGYAHLFEHMMFRGSAHVGVDEHVRLIRGVGGTYNGRTEHDITSYYETLPRSQLALGLYLEADRMASFHVTDEIYRIERDVVLEEISLRTNSPFVPAQEFLFGEMFRSHPYHWSPIGNPQHLKTADVSELQQFFDHYCVPNNATLVITGDFAPADAKKLVHSYFAWIPAGPAVVRKIAPEPAQIAPRRAEIDGPVGQTMLMVGFRVPGFGADQEAAMVVLHDAIESRVLYYLKLEENHLSSSTFSQLLRLEDEGCLCFGAALLPGADLQRAERIINVRLQLLRQEGVVASEAQFRAATDSLCSAILRQRQTAEGLAEQIARGAVLRGRPDASDRLVGQLRALTAPIVQAAATRYLWPDSMTVLIIRPQHNQPQAQEIAAISSDAAAPAPATNARRIEFPADYPAAPPVAAVEDSRIALSAYTRSFSEMRIDGSQVILVPAAHPGRIDMSILLPYGSQDDPAGREGIGLLTARSALSTMDQTGTSRGVRQTPEFTTVSLSMPNPAAEHYLQQFNVALSEPMLAPWELRIFPEKWKLFNDRRTQNTQAIDVADLDLRAELFGDSPLARSVSATSLRTISRQEIEAYRRRLFKFDEAVILIGGDVSPEQARVLVTRLKGNASPAAIAPSTIETSPKQPVGGAPSTAAAGRNRPRVILINAPGLHESLIRIGSVVPALSASELPAAELAGPILADRIWRTVRSDKGYSYLVDADFHQYRGAGQFVVQTDASLARTGTILSTVLENIAGMARMEISESELSAAKAGSIGRALTSFQTPLLQGEWRAMSLVRGQQADLPSFVEQTQGVSAAQIRELFARDVRPENLVVIIVAPAAVVRRQIQSLGDVELRQLPNLRPGASTRPAYEEIPKPNL